MESMTRMDDREAAWAELHAATPPDWQVGSRRLAALVLILATLGAAGCELVEPSGREVPTGMRALIIPVANESGRPAVLLVAEDRHPVGQPVGSAEPAVVPPGQTLDVRFIVPNAPGWAIFVNPGPEIGPLLMEVELRNCVGHVPASIQVGPRGEPSWGHGRDPGCLTVSL
jgi:hypothetical protein